VFKTSITYRIDYGQFGHDSNECDITD